VKSVGKSRTENGAVLRAPDDGVLSCHAPIRGFTLVELAVVVVIIGLLAAIILPNYVRLKEKAREAEAKASLHNIQLALEQFGTDYRGNYPRYLIGGDNTILEVTVYDDRHVSQILTETPVMHASDVLLREGYVDSYPRNPFVTNSAAVQLMQKDVGDPLRNSYPDGEAMGTRFGAYGRTMGQCLCDARWLQWLYTDPVTNEQELCDTWSNIQFDFYDVWLGNRQKPYLAGSFAYKSIGEIVPSPGDSGDQDFFKVDDKQALMPHDNRDDATIPVDTSSYFLSVWGGYRTKGMDVLGEEPLVFFAYKGTRRHPYSPITFFIDPISGSRQIPSPAVADTVDLIGIPPWTRGVNRSHVGPLWGSPYGPAGDTEVQLIVGNANGLRDALILVLTAGEH